MVSRADGGSLPEAYDYVIVGAGSAGCTLAARLSESGKHSVLLLEAGGSDRHLWVHVPLGVGKLLNDASCVWKANTEPQAELHGNKLYWPSGRILGGSSSVNGIVFVRGHPAKYDEWQAAGCPGWGYADVLPYFKRLEDCSFGDPKVRGRGGPISVTELGGDAISDAFVAACGEAGYPRVTDYNAYLPDGAAPLQVSTRRGMRCSAAVGYLEPSMNRSNLRVVTNALATRIVCDGASASGVSYVVGGDRREARARREVLVASGAIRSPQLLELSGIGDAALLRERGIEVVAHLPSVGRNLQDHLMPRITFECNRAITVNDMLGNPLKLVAALMRYLVFRDGLFATTTLTALAYVRGHATSRYPDIRLQSALVSAESRFSTSRKTGIDAFPGFHIGGYFLYPASRGELHIGSRDANEAPKINANYLNEPIDREMIVSVLKLTRKIASQPALARLIVRETRPGPKVASDDELLDYARRTAQTCWHPSGTCKMGSGDDAVVDPQLRVRGVAGLRVIDTSVMPFLTASNTNIPTIMIAEKGADLVLRDAVATG
ncbi:MAG TPA: GMC family oxidoreductase N-terminal domain-containing protein [Casimicrobiaceae bacterium]|nr:GMC family oxidoreductase N-terminal domain-containing protein [Casimicrobiaceae bacterium]